MAIDVGSRISGSTVDVGNFDTTYAGASLSITSTPTVQDNAAITIAGTGFSSSGNSVYLDDVLIPVDGESTTSIVTDILDIASLPLATPVELYVVDADGNESNRISLTILPRSGHKGFVLTSAPGDPQFRFESTPDIEIGDEIEVRNIVGTNVTPDDVNVDPTGALDVPAALGGDPELTSGEYRVKDQFERSSTWAAFSFSGVLDTTVSVPDALGLTQSEATALIEAANLEVGTVTSAYSAVYSAGHVSAQFPTAGTVVLAGSNVTLALSLGPAPLTVPDLTGLTTTEASDLLVSLGLTLGTVYRYIDGVSSGLILGQVIAAGTVLDAGDPVDVVISSNLLPDVVGMLLLDAVNTLADANLLVEDITATVEYSATVPEGYVIRQSPLADAEVSPGDTVTLTVSLGQNQDLLVTVPYLIGSLEGPARARIEALYCVPEVIGSGGTVQAQSPTFMTIADRGSTIQITMGGPVNASRRLNRNGLPPYGAPDSVN